MKSKLSCTCGENCQKQQVEFPSGIAIQVPQCLFIAGIFSDRDVMRSVRNMDIHLLTEELEKAKEKLESARRFWERAEMNLSAEITPPKIPKSPDLPQPVTEEPVKPVPMPSQPPERPLNLERFTGKGTKPMNLCCGSHGSFHKKECVNYKARSYTRDCCGSQGPRHKAGCTEAGAPAPPKPPVAPSNILMPVVEEPAEAAELPEAPEAIEQKPVVHNYVCISCDKEWRDSRDFDEIKEDGGCPSCGMRNIFQND